LTPQTDVAFRIRSTHSSAEGEADQDQAEAYPLRTMPVERVPSSSRPVSASDILKAESAERSLVARVGVFDVYRGEGVAEGAKSIAIHVTLQPRERTLTDSEIGAAIAKIVASVENRRDAQELKPWPPAPHRAVLPLLAGPSASSRRPGMPNITSQWRTTYAFSAWTQGQWRPGSARRRTSARKRRAVPALVRAHTCRPANRALH
jgi:hypothetical protein